MAVASLPPPGSSFNEKMLGDANFSPGAEREADRPAAPAGPAGERQGVTGFRRGAERSQLSRRARGGTIPFPARSGPSGWERQTCRDRRGCAGSSVSRSGRSRFALQVGLIGDGRWALDNAPAPISCRRIRRCAGLSVSRYGRLFRRDIVVPLTLLLDPRVFGIVLLGFCPALLGVAPCFDEGGAGGAAGGWGASDGG